MAVLELEDLSVAITRDEQRVSLLEAVSLTVEEGQAVGLVGESGSGKSMTARSIVRRLPANAHTSGSISFAGRSVLSMDARQLRAYRRHDVAMIFQDPRAAINPVRSVGDFLTEGLRLGRGLSTQAARGEAVRLLDSVGIDRSASRLRQYPHELSGGMLQRVMIASAIGSGARLILADEPTTALDVSIQAEVVLLLNELRREHHLALLFITHDLDLAVGFCDRIEVMYAGSIMESRPAASLYESPRHPYTSALIACRPSVRARSDRLLSIPGAPVSAAEAPPGCVFSDRCRYCVQACLEARPALEPEVDGFVRCHRSAELAGTIQATHRVAS